MSDRPLRRGQSISQLQPFDLFPGEQAAVDVEIDLVTGKQIGRATITATPGLRGVWRRWRYRHLRWSRGAS